MDKKKWITGTALCVFLCGTGVALGQLHRSTGSSVEAQKQRPMGRSAGMTIAPLTPAQKENEDKKYRLDQAAAAALDAGRYEEAEDDARQSMSLGHDSGLAEKFLAAALNAQGKVQEALDTYQQMANEGTDDPSDLLPYALLLLKTGQWARAVEAYNKQLPYLGDEFQGSKAALMSAYGPFSPDTPRPRELAVAIHIGLGVTYAAWSWGRHSQDDKALHEYEQAVALAPDSGLPHLYYGHKLQKLGRRAEAQAAFRRAAALGHGAVKAAAERALKG